MTATSPDFDLAIVGSGFGGSLLAMIARRLGYRTVLLERGRHPRFAIGESASPLAGILIEQLADRYNLPRVRPLSAFGSWRRAYPDVVCGLKRGFTYFRQERGTPYHLSADRSNQLLVAASPNDELSDTHWLRADVDEFLVGEAMSAGVEYLDEVQLESFDRAGSVPVLGGTRRGAPLSIRTGLVVDASGPNGFISRALSIENVGFAGYPRTQALFSHFTGVARCEEMPGYVAPLKGAPYVNASAHGVPDEGTPRERPPYAMDDAALHHVFDGGWMWVLRFGNGVTSAGIAVTDDLASELGLPDGAPAWHRFLSRYPSIAAQFADAQPTREFTWMPTLSWRAARASGPGWAMLPSAAAFVDPLFSTGIPLTLLGIERLARILEGRPQVASPDALTRPRGKWRTCDSVEADLRSAFRRIRRRDARRSRSRGALHCRLLRGVPAVRTVRRLLDVLFRRRELQRDGQAPGRPRRRRRLPWRRPPACRQEIDRLSPDRAAMTRASPRRSRAAIEPLNIAGPRDPGKRNWYPVDLQDTVRGAANSG